MQKMQRGPVGGQRRQAKDQVLARLGLDNVRRANLFRGDGRRSAGTCTPYGTVCPNVQYGMYKCTVTDGLPSHDHYSPSHRSVPKAHHKWQSVSLGPLACSTCRIHSFVRRPLSSHLLHATGRPRSRRFERFRPPRSCLYRYLTGTTRLRQKLRSKRCSKSAGT
jgi:hypothetical protein